MIMKCFKLQKHKKRKKEAGKKNNNEKINLNLPKKQVNKNNKLRKLIKIKSFKQNKIPIQMSQKLIYQTQIF